MNLEINKIYQQFNKLSRQQKKIIAVGSVIFFALFIFWILVYVPLNKKLTSIKNELKNTDAQIAAIMSSLLGKEMNEAVKDLRLSLQKAADKLPGEYAPAISYIADAARNLKIDIKSITPGQSVVLEDAQEGYIIEELPLSLDMACGYRALGEYLYALRNDSGILIRLRELDMRSGAEGTTSLSAVLKISAYLAREK